MDSVGRNRVSLPFFAPLFCLFFLGCFSLLLRLCTLFFAFFQRLRALRVAHASGAGSPPSRPCLSPFLSRLHAFTLPHARRVCARMHMHPVQPSAPRAPGCAHVHIRMSSSLRSPWAKTACSSVAPGAASKSHSADVRANWAARNGGAQVGIVVGCLRKLQRWNLTSIFEEYRRCAGSKVCPSLVSVSASTPPPPLPCLPPSISSRLCLVWSSLVSVSAKTPPPSLPSSPPPLPPSTSSRLCLRVLSPR